MVSGLVSVLKDFGFTLELLVLRLCMSYFCMKTCKKQLLNEQDNLQIFLSQNRYIEA